MKTAISIPDELFTHAERWAHTLGISRSAFFARAAERYVKELSKQSLVDEINAALALAGEDEATRDVVEYSRRRLAEDAEDW